MTTRELLEKLLKVSVPLDDGIVEFQDGRIVIKVAIDGRELGYIIE